MTRETYLAGVLADATRTFRYRAGVAWLLGYPDTIGPEPVPARPPATALPYVRSRRSSRQTAWATPLLDDWTPHTAAATGPMPTSAVAPDDSECGTPAVRGQLPITLPVSSAFGGDARRDGAETAPAEEFFVVAPDRPPHDAVVAPSTPEGWAAPEVPAVRRTARVAGGDLGGLHGTPLIGLAAPAARDVDHAAARPTGTADGDLAEGPAAPALRDGAIVALRSRSSGAEVLGSGPDDLRIASLAERSRYWQPLAAPEDVAAVRATAGQQDAPAGRHHSAADVSAGHTPVRTPSAERRVPGVPVPVAANPSGPRSGRLRLAATAAIADSTSEAFDDVPRPRARLATNADTAFGPVAEDAPWLEPVSESLSTQAAVAPVPDVVQILPAGEEIHGGAPAFWTRRHVRRWQIGLLR